MKSPQLQFVAITFADGSLGVMQFVVQEYLPSGIVRWERLPTKNNVDAEIARGAWDAHLLPIKGWRLIDPGDVPTDRTYRGAWSDDGNAIVHDMTRAREVHRDRLRRARAAALAELDGKWMRATGQGKTKEAAAIEAERQKLRDAPADPRIDAAETIKDLTALG